MVTSIHFFIIWHLLYLFLLILLIKFFVMIWWLYFRLNQRSLRWGSHLLVLFWFFTLVWSLTGLRYPLGKLTGTVESPTVKFVWAGIIRFSLMNFQSLIIDQLNLFIIRRVRRYNLTSFNSLCSLLRSTISKLPLYTWFSLRRLTP